MLTRTGVSTVIYSDNITDTNVTISDLDAVTMYSLTVTAINDEGFRSEISDIQNYTTKELVKTIIATPTEKIVNYLLMINTHTIWGSTIRQKTSTKRPTSQTEMFSFQFLFC